HRALRVEHRSSRERGLRLRGDRGKRRRLRGGEIGEHLPIERAARGFQPANELRVGEPLLARGGVDAHYPETAVLALLVLAADVRVLERGVDRLFGGAIELALRLIEALRTCKQLLSFRAPDCSSFDSRHFCLVL